MIWLLNTAVVLVTIVAMEGVAWLTHKYIMHGLLWRLHKDHHQPAPNQYLEKNDYFFIFFSMPAIICFAIGSADYSLPFWIAVGISIYGILYFFVHDLFIHQRIKVLRNADGVYFRAIRRAHKMHHKHLDKEDGECFGMLWVPLKYFREARKAGKMSM
jgi:beta-carotene 3-hydroxylase